MSVLEEKFGTKKKVGEEEEIKDVETKTILHSKQSCTLNKRLLESWLVIYVSLISRKTIF